MRGRGWVWAAGATLLVGSSVLPGAPAGAIPGSACIHPIVISRLAFGPGTVLPSQQSTARLAGMNCTKKAQTVKITWTGRYPAADATGCPVVDPVVQTVTVPGRKNLAAHLAYTVIKGCTADIFTVTARLTDQAGKRISTKTASLRIAHKPVSKG